MARVLWSVTPFTTNPVTRGTTMKHSIRPAVLAVTAAAALIASGCGSGSGGSGTGGAVDSDGSFAVNTSACPPSATTELADGAPLRVGSVMPLSGQYSSVGGPVSRGIEIYFDRINKAGGIGGHTLELVTADDAYDPSKTVPKVSELLEKEQVFATLGQIGTPNVAAAQPLAEQHCVPQLWVGTGAPQFGDPANHAWTTSGFLSYSTESKMLAESITSQKLGTKVAMLELDTDLGKAYVDSFKAAAKDTGLEVVGTQKLSPTASTVTNEVTSLLATKPDVVVIASFVPSCAKAMGALAQGGFTGTVITTYACSADTIFPSLGQAAKGAMTVAINQPTADRSNPDVKQFVDDVKAYGKGEEINDDVFTGYRLGDLFAQTAEAALEKDGGLTPANLMNAAWSMDGTFSGEWGGVAKTDGTKDAYVLEYGQMLTFDGSKFHPIGDPVDLEGATGAFSD